MASSARVGMLFAALFAIVAIVGANADVSDKGRPDKKTHQAAKAKEAAEAKKKAAADAKKGPLNKAVEMLDKLKDQVIAEGAEEAKTYDKFACFCKDTTKEKLEAIKKGEDEQTTLSTEIGSLGNKRTGKDTKIKEYEDDIADDEKLMKSKRVTRVAEKRTYESNTEDMDDAIKAITDAIESTDAKEPALAQLRAAHETIRTAVAFADALGLDSEISKQTFESFLQEGDASKYDPSSGVESMLENKLLPQFRKKKAEIDQAEANATKAYDSWLDEKKAAVRDNNRLLEKTKKKKDDIVSEIEASSARLTTVSGQLLDDKQYTNKLSKMCSGKAKTWDQRSAMRAAEIQTLLQAVSVLKNAVSSQISGNTARLAQVGVTVRYAQSVASDPTAMSAIELAAEAVDAGSPSFLQVKSSSAGSALVAAARKLRGAGSDDDNNGRRVIASLLMERGTELKSTLLVSLASQVSADPLAKVKVLIKELIERLMSEAGKESNQKAWCDKATSEATATRNSAAGEVRDLNSEMAQLEATMDELKEEIATLEKEISQVTDARDKAELERSNEKDENKATIEEAKEGLKQLQTCIDVLAKFYKNSKKAEVKLSLAQASPGDEVPETSFKTGEAYQGSQAESGGILGMLDVMKSDFARTIKETNAEERSTNRDHLDFMGETATSLAEKREAVKEKKAQKASAKNKHGEADDALDEQSKFLKNAIEEIIKLKPTCVDTGMSYEDRVARREQEIESLHKANCILEKVAEYGPEGAGDAC